MKLDYCKDLWTNTVDYYWVDETDNLVKSPYFSSKEEAEKFCDKVDQLTSWPFTVPLSCQPEEIFCADSAFGWCLDEIEACNKSVAA